MQEEYIAANSEQAIIVSIAVSAWSHWTVQPWNNILTLTIALRLQQCPAKVNQCSMLINLQQ